MDGDRVLACDLGGTRLRAAIVQADGSVLGRQAVPTPADDPGVLVRLVRAVADRAGEGLAGAVVGVPGPVDYSRGEVPWLPNLPSWEGHLSAAGLSRDLALRVLLANDADLAALGEHSFGAGRGFQDMLYVTSSTGVGAGVILGGALLRGSLSLAEVGHTIIDRSDGGTVESLGSGTALARIAEDDPASVVARAARGDLNARQLFAGVARDFAIGVFNMVHCYSPEIVVIGGGMSRAGELLVGPVRAMLASCGHVCPASRARLALASGGDDVGLKGAAAYWADHGVRDS